MRTRTNLHIENEALSFATAYASAKGIKLGVAVSELILRAEHTPEPPARVSSRLRKDKHGYLVVKARGPVITSEEVKEESEDELG